MATGRIGTTPVLTTRWSKAPSAGTTSLSGLDDNSVSLVYSVGYEAVYRNGVLLSRGNDYTATDGTTITLIDATIAGDIIEVFANQTIPLTDTYSQTVANGKFINNTLTTTTGDIIYASAANTPARLAIGSTDQVLKVSGGIPAWGTASAGANWSLLNTGGTALTGAQTITVSGISAKDKVLVIIDGGSSANAWAYISFRINTDTGSNYSQYGINFDNGSALAGKYTGSSITLGRCSDNAASVIHGGIQISGCNSSGVKVLSFNSYASKSGGTNEQGYSASGIWNNSASVTSISLITDTGNWDAGTVYVYTSA